jgi:SAM-dependent methyltransferase
MSDPVYDTIGRTYARTRRADPRIQTAIWEALGDARTVVSVGAGTGSYEPSSTVLAIEPSAAMIAQRPPGAAPAVQANAEDIPLEDGACDAAMAVLTIHHWNDPERGVREMRRVAGRLVVLTWDPEWADRLWLVRDYLAEGIELDRVRMPSIADLSTWMGGAEVAAAQIPHDCEDGFMCAYWRRPAAYLDPDVRAGISVLAQLGASAERAVAGLRDDLRSGEWERRNHGLLGLEAADFGYCLLTGPRPV